MDLLAGLLSERNDIMGCFFTNCQNVKISGSSFNNFGFKTPTKYGPDRDVLGCEYGQKGSSASKRPTKIFSNQNFLNLCKNEPKNNWNSCNNTLDQQCKQASNPTTTKPAAATKTTAKTPAKKPTTKGKNSKGLSAGDEAKAYKKVNELLKKVDNSAQNNGSTAGNETAQDSNNPGTNCSRKVTCLFQSFCLIVLIHVSG